MNACRHCGEAVPATRAGSPWCCAGCAAAAAFVAELGLDDFYRLRSAPAPVPREDAALAREWDAPALRVAHVRAGRDGDEALLEVDGLRCAACAWLVERALRAQPGVREAALNGTTARLFLRLDPGLPLAPLALVVARLGYRLLPPDAAAAARLRTRRTALKRLAVAGIGTLQSMMFAEALYFGGDAMPPAVRDALRWLGLALAAPVVFYAGAPFLRGARAELARARPGMDLLVTTSVLLAFAASIVETVRGGAAVWFDAAVMFVFLLLATRTVEQRLRERAQAGVERRARALPAQATRLRDGTAEIVPAEAIVVGDELELRADEVSCVDGTLLDACAAFDESLATGEALPVAKRRGDAVLAGSVCRERGVRIRATRVGADTTLALLARLVARAQAQRPRLARLADRFASATVVVLLAAAALTAIAWQLADPARAVPATLAVLAASCPCALSLAVPAALAAVHGQLAARGVLLLDGDALERLANVDCVVLDKTGTLTRGRAQLGTVDAEPAERTRALAIAAALEHGVPHPLARAFAPHADARLVASDVHVVAGQGVAGIVDGRRWRLGGPAFAGVAGEDDGRLVLASDGVALARFALEDPLRADSAAAVAALHALGLETILLSGDAAPRVAQAAQRLAIADARARVTPDGKLQAVAALQAAGRRVAMAGDGLNDAAVLARADVGIAMAAGAALAQVRADLVLAGDSPAGIAQAIAEARRTRRVMRQNLAWASAYNLAIVPIAAFGLLPPWLAALGMCGSSLLVTLNALRLARPMRVAPLPSAIAQVLPA